MAPVSRMRDGHDRAVAAPVITEALFAGDIRVLHNRHAIFNDPLVAVFPSGKVLAIEQDDCVRGRSTARFTGRNNRWLFPLHTTQILALCRTIWHGERCRGREDEGRSKQHF